MPTNVEKAKCDGCESCVDACPVEAIAMVDGIAVVNQDDCTDCETCIDTCPSEAISMD